VTVPPGFISTLRGSLGQLVWSKVALAATVALALGLGIAFAFGMMIEVGDVTVGEPWERLPLLAVGLVLAGGALGALGAPRRAREGGALGLARRGARRDADRLPRPDPGGGRAVGRLAERPAAVHARGPLLPLGAVRPLPGPEVARETLWLLVLGGIFGVLARVEARKLSA
jgi:hypothetical protein